MVTSSEYLCYGHGAYFSTGRRGFVVSFSSSYKTQLVLILVKYNQNRVIRNPSIISTATLNEINFVDACTRYFTSCKVKYKN